MPSQRRSRSRPLLRVLHVPQVRILERSLPGTSEQPRRHPIDLLVSLLPNARQRGSQVMGHRHADSSHRERRGERIAVKVQMTLGRIDLFG